MIILSILTLYFIWGVPKVPFHPDESTYLFMSQDWDAIINHPFSLAYQPSFPIDSAMRYRLIDAPLVRYAIGFGRTLAGLAPLTTDWNWSLDWAANQKAGALPDQRLLLTARFAVALFYPLTLICVYLTGRQLNGPVLGMVASFLVGVNPLVLLHARRAMSEGVLLFCTAFFLLALVSFPRRTWLVALAAGLSIAAKQSTFPLALVGLVAVVWQARSQARIKPILLKVSVYLAVLFAVFFLLNPVLWANPLAAGEAMIRTRLEFTTRQTGDLQRVDPERALNSPGKRVLSALGQIYLLPPAYEDIGNYSTELTPQELVYQSLPVETTQRGLTWGGFFLLLTLIGLPFSWLQFKKVEPSQRHILLLFLLAAACQGLALVALIPTAYQRYWLPEIPFLGILEAYGIVSLGWFAREFYLSRKPPFNSTDGTPVS
ncbi:MAG: glycosyltransferase family 39 protein [Anaerolineaceae bacterium]|nr:glycosyltransferase family 39 protein [Anaerolineaceae bacterium]